MYNQDVHMNYSKQPGVVDGIPANAPPNYHYNEHPQRHTNPQHQHMTPWSSGLCDCCSDVKNCCITCWCPCITFGQIAEIVDQGTTSCAVSGAIHGVLTWFTGCGWIYSCLYRSKLRKHYMLEDRPCNDCLVHCCCECCALCQEYRELESRGFDMSLGWHENVARQNRGVAMASAPVIGGTMTR